MRVFWSGNIAVAEGALRAGCKFFAAYPITPASDLMEYMLKRIVDVGGVFVQAEDEIAAINMVIGASWAGVKAMTATSGPGFSLMQEGIGYAVMTETPIVVVDVMRVGPGTGQASKAAQGDVLQARWGRHGDQAVVVYAPSTPYEAYLLAIEAFNTAEELRVPVILLYDELIAHTWESFNIPQNVTIRERVYAKPGDKPFDSDRPDRAPPMPRLGDGLNVLVTGSTHDAYGYRYTASHEVHDRLVRRLVGKVLLNASKLFKFEKVFYDSKPRILIISYGSPARNAIVASRILYSEGVKSIGVLKLKTLWPLNEELLKSILSSVERVFVVEMNLGQIVYDIERLSPRDCKIELICKVGGGIPIYPEEIVNRVLEVV